MTSRGTGSGEHAHPAGPVPGGAGGGAGRLAQDGTSIESGRYLPSLLLAFTIARFFDLTVDKMFDPAEEAGA